jgi:hypothetical protein
MQDPADSGLDQNRKRSNDHATDLKSLLHRRIGPACICGSGPRKLATAFRTGLGDRPLRRLFRSHIDVLRRVAPTIRGRGTPHCVRGGAGGLASTYTGSLVQSLGGIIQRRRGVDGGFDC